MNIKLRLFFIQLLFDFYVILVNSLSKFKNFLKTIIQIISSITLFIMTPACRLLKVIKSNFLFMNMNMIQMLKVLD